ncbi:MAG: cation diffusion facilitator family transporter [Enterocloster clostridioformis]
MYVSSISIIVNLLLSLFKLIAGIIARSDAMISDAVHSASDVLSTIVVIVGSKISSKESDTEHPYGHERIECVSSVSLSGMLLVAIGIGIVGVKKIIAGSTG